MKRYERLLALVICIVWLSAGSIVSAEEISSDLNTDSFYDKEVDIIGKTDVHLTSSLPIHNSIINLHGECAWLYLDAVKPTAVISDYLKFISIDGVPANINSNCRIAEYGAGTVLIPNGVAMCNKALTIYTGENFTGDSQSIAIQNHNTDLGKFDNNIRSIKLHKGFIATLANNADGTGYSRCFIASDDDIEIPILPEGFVTKDGSGRSFVSYIRVMKWQWVSKKGWSGSDQGQMERLNVTHYYGWDAGGPTDKIDREYVPHRHHIGWPGFDQIKSRDNVSHVLGQNEPDNTSDAKEHPASPLEIIREWPDFMRTGLRVGSPAPTGIWGSWLTDFFTLADSLNYRVDFVVYHQYEHTADFKARVDKAVSVSKGRPVWITEWNNGANWTTSNENDWPDKTGVKCDAEGNPISGAETVTLPATIGNQQLQLEYMKKALAAIDACDKLERTNFYTWVQDARSVELDGKKTLAGQYFANYPSVVGFKKSSEYEHVWKIAPPLPYVNYSDDYKNVKLTWYDHNGETGKNYIVYRRDDSGTTWNKIKTLELGKDYQAGETVVFEEPITCNTRSRYRIQATAYNDEVSINSRVSTVYRDDVSEAPAIRCSASDPNTVKVEWSEIENARGYLVERRLEGENVFNAVKTTDGCTFTDNYVEGGNTYHYRVTVLSNSDYTPVSDIATVKTPYISNPPEGVFNLFAASGDKTVTVSWDKTYRTSWTIERAISTDGPWDEIAKDLSTYKYIDNAVDNGNTYYYRITPYRYELKGDLSDVVSATPKAGNYIFIPFNEGAFSKARDYYNGYDATLESGALWCKGRDGCEKSAVSLNSSKEGHISLPKNILSDINDFTISLWVKPGNIGGRIFDFGKDTGTFMILNYSGGAFRYKLTNGSKTVDKNNISYRMDTDKWYHVAVSQNGSTVALYINGEQIATASNAPYPSEMGKTANNYLGKSQWAQDPHPDFSYDDFYIFNRGMTAQEIKVLASEESGIDDIVYDNDTDGLSVRLENGSIIIESSKEIDINIYSIDGRLALSTRIFPGENRIEGLAKGFYIVGNHKIILK